jgi:hypothetical protein
MLSFVQFYQPIGRCTLLATTIGTGDLRQSPEGGPVGVPPSGGDWGDREIHHVSAAFGESRRVA